MKLPNLSAPKSPPKSAKQRQAELRVRKAAKGLKRVEFWLTDHEQVMLAEILTKLRSQRKNDE